MISSLMAFVSKVDLSSMSKYKQASLNKLLVHVVYETDKLGVQENRLYSKAHVLFGPRLNLLKQKYSWSKTVNLNSVLQIPLQSRK